MQYDSVIKQINKGQCLFKDLKMCALLTFFIKFDLTICLKYYMIKFKEIYKFIIYKYIIYTYKI